MPTKKLKNKWENRHKLTYKELEWDYLPIIVLFAVVSGILTLLLILLIVFQGVRVQGSNLQFDLFESNLHIRNYLENNPIDPSPTPEIFEEFE